MEFSTENSNYKLIAWRTALQEDLTVEQWESAHMKALKQTGNTRSKLFYSVIG